MTVPRLLAAWLVLSVLFTPLLGAVVVHGGRRHPTPKPKP